MGGAPWERLVCARLGLARQGPEVSLWACALAGLGSRCQPSVPLPACLFREQVVLPRSVASGFLSQRPVVRRWPLTASEDPSLKTGTVALPPYFTGAAVTEPSLRWRGRRRYLSARGVAAKFAAIVLKLQQASSIGAREPEIREPPLPLLLSLSLLSRTTKTCSLKSSGKIHTKFTALIIFKYRYTLLYCTLQMTSFFFFLIK